MNNKQRVLILYAISLLVLIIFVNPAQKVVYADEIDAVTVNRGDTIILKGVLKNSEDEGIPNETLLFFDETHDVFLGANKTDETGLAMLFWSIPINYSVGKATLNVTYNGNNTEYYLATSSKVEIWIVGKIKTTFVVHDYFNEEFDKVTTPGTSVDIEVKIVDEFSQPLANITITLLDENNTVICEVITDSLGVANIKMDVPNREGIFTYKIIASDANQGYQNNTSSFTLVVTQLDTYIDAPSSIFGSINMTIKILGQVIPTDGGEITEKLDVFLEDEYSNIIVYNYTFNNGCFQFDLFLDNDYFGLGNKSLYIHFPGDNKYHECFYEIVLIIRDHPNIFLENSTQEIFRIGDMLSIKVILSDSFNNSISNQILYFKINNTLLTQSKTNSLGYASFNWIIDFEPGIIQVTIEYPGNATYWEAILIFKLKILNKIDIYFIKPIAGMYYSFEENVPIEILFTSKFLTDSTVVKLLIEVPDILTIFNDTITLNNNTILNLTSSFNPELFLLNYTQIIITARILENESNFISESYATTHIYLGLKIKTHLKISKIVNLTSYNEKELICRLFMFNNTPIPNKTVILLVNNTYYTNNVTNSEGLVHFIIQFSEEGIYNITVLFNGDHQYLGANDKKILSLRYDDSQSNSDSDLPFEYIFSNLLSLGGLISTIFLAGLVIFMKTKTRLINIGNRIQIISKIRFIKKPLVLNISVLLLYLLLFVSVFQPTTFQNYPSIHKNDATAYILNIYTSPQNVTVGTILNITVEYILDYPSDLGSGHVSVSILRSNEEVGGYITYQKGHIFWNISFFIDPEVWDPGENNETGEIVATAIADDGSSSYFNTKTQTFTVTRSLLDITTYVQKTNVSYFEEIKTSFSLYNIYNDSILLENYSIEYKVLDTEQNTVINDTKHTNDTIIEIVINTTELNAKKYTLKIYFDGNNDYFSFEYKFNVTVYNASTYLNAWFSKVEVYSFVEYDVDNSTTVLNIRYEQIKNDTVTSISNFSLVITSVFYNKTIRDVTSPYSLEIIAPSSCGTYNFKIHVSKENYETKEMTIELFVLRRSLSIVENKSDFRLYPLKNNTFSYKIIDLIASGSANSSINFVVYYQKDANWTEITSTKAIMGMLTFSWSPPLDLIFSDFVTIKIIHYSDEIYNFTIFYETIIINKTVDVKFFGNISDMVLGYTYNISVQLKLHNEVYLAFKEILIVDNNTGTIMGNGTTNEEGILNATIEVSSLFTRGMHKLDFLLIDADKSMTIEQVNVIFWDIPKVSLEIIIL